MLLQRKSCLILATERPRSNVVRKPISQSKHGRRAKYHNSDRRRPGPVLGVDILDPVQTSAREMDLPTLKRRYGTNVCWHGGIDVQRLLPHGTPADVRAAVQEAESLFADDGNLILGPSHEITPDTPLENVLAIYE